MPDLTPITQRDVADACGFHPSTVCLALKNSPSIPLETRERIQRAAEKLGYQPNVAARNLALLRNDRKTAGSLPIAWINQELRRDHWRIEPKACMFFESARRRASDLGYHLEEIWTREPGMTVTRIIQILRARGIEGVIFPADRSFDFSLLQQGWGGFAMVGCNDHRLNEWIDVVAPDYHRNTLVALRRLQHLGYERPGLMLTANFDAASQGLVHGAFLRYQSEMASDDRVPVCFVSDREPCSGELLNEWHDEHRPDALLGAGIVSGRELSRRDAGVAWIQLDGASEPCDAGVDPQPAEIAGLAIECLVEKLRRFEHGLREATRLHLVKGAWEERALARREIQTSVA